MSGEWLFRGALAGSSAFFCTCCICKLGSEGTVPHSVGGLPHFLRVLAHTAYGRGTAVGPQSGERCWPLLAGCVEGYRTPDEALVC